MLERPVPWYFPRSAEDQTMRGIEVGQAAVETGVEGVSLQ